jgi:hypothetical protein
VSTFDASAQAADFSFRGTVESLHAATEAAIEPSDETVVVKVDDVLHAPEAVTGFAGQRVTVRLQEAGSVSEGEEAVFFADGWIFGDTLALQEVAHFPVEGEGLAARVGDARTAGADALARDRVNRGNLVVRGRVADVRPPGGAAEGVAAGRPGEAAPVSEHDPAWMEAVVAVDETLKGSPPEGETVVAFPSSMDVAWAHVPKFVPGQEGVFILHRAEDVPQLAAAPGRFLAPTRGDVLAPDQTERVKGLIDEPAEPAGA